MRVAYVARGDLRSRNANTVQAAKMSAAIASCYSDVVILTPIDLYTLLTAGVDGNRAGIMDELGLPEPFPLHVLCSSLTFEPERRNKWARRIFLARAGRWIARERPGLVVTREHRIVRHCVAIGQPVLFEQHEPASSKQFNGFRALSAAPCFIGLITISETLGASYVNEIGVPAAKIFIAPSGFDMPRGATPVASRATLRTQVALPVDAFVAVYCGSLFEHKGVDQVIEAAARLPEVQFVIVGARPSERFHALRARAAKRQLSNICFTGHQPNAVAFRYMRAADVCLLPNSALHPSADYTSPLKLFEYMASGTPVVAADIPALQAVGRHEDNMIKVPPGRVNEWVDAINRLRGDRELAFRVARQAAEDVQEFGWTQRVKRIMEYFSGAIRGL